MDIAARIKFFREQKGYTVNKLANLAGISQSYLRSVELGQKTQRLKRFQNSAGLWIFLYEIFLTKRHFPACSMMNCFSRCTD